jgi:hypothetical protein
LKDVEQNINNIYPNLNTEYEFISSLNHIVGSQIQIMLNESGGGTF